MASTPTGQRLEGMWWEPIVFRTDKEPGFVLGFQWHGRDSTLFGLLEGNGAPLENWNVPSEMLEEPTDLYEIGTVAKPTFLVSGKMFLEISKSIKPSFAPRDERTANPVSWFGKTITVPIGPKFEVTMPGPVAWMLEMEMRNWWGS